MATDIAFALAVLAVLSTHLPSALRAFLLTLAVVDDLGAILVIAVFFTTDLNPVALAGAAAGLVVFYLLQRYRVRGWWWYVPLGLVIWALTYTGGVHATVAGVAMGLLLRTRPRPAGRGGRFARRAHRAPAAAGLGRYRRAAVRPVRRRGERLGARTGRGVHPPGAAGRGAGPGDRQDGRDLRRNLPGRPLHPGPSSTPTSPGRDVFALAVLAGIGFTVALLIGELAFTDPADAEHIKAAVLVGSLIAAGLAALLLKRRNGIYRRLWEAENRDEDADGHPAVDQHGTGDFETRTRPSPRGVRCWSGMLRGSCRTGRFSFLHPVSSGAALRCQHGNGRRGGDAADRREHASWTPPGPTRLCPTWSPSSAARSSRPDVCLPAPVDPPRRTSAPSGIHGATVGPDYDACPNRPAGTAKIARHYSTAEAVQHHRSHG